MDGIQGARLDGVTEAETNRAKAELDVDYWASVRDDAIRELLTDGVPVKAVVSASGLSRERVYQIRDKRR